MRSRKRLLAVLLAVVLGGLALLVGLGLRAADEPPVDDRIRALEQRAGRLSAYRYSLRLARARQAELHRVDQEIREAKTEADALMPEAARERGREWWSWQARFRREVHRRTGWFGDAPPVSPGKWVMPELVALDVLQAVAIGLLLVLAGLAVRATRLRPLKDRGKAQGQRSNERETTRPEANAEASQGERPRPWGSWPARVGGEVGGRTASLVEHRSVCPRGGLVRNKVVVRLLLPVAIGLLLLLAGLGVRAAREPSLDDRINAAGERWWKLLRHEYTLRETYAPQAEIEQTHREMKKAKAEEGALMDERARQGDAWPARLRRGIRRRIGR